MSPGVNIGGNSEYGVIHVSDAPTQAVPGQGAHVVTEELQLRHQRALALVILAAVFLERNLKLLARLVLVQDWELIDVRNSVTCKQKYL